MNPTKMTGLQERFDKYATTVVNEFELYIEVQRLIMEDDTTSNAKLKAIAKDSVMELFKSTKGVVGKTLGGVKDYILNQRKLDIAGKVVNLVNKYQIPEEKKVIRAMLVRVSFDLFRSYEHQFMHAERTHGGWSQAMVQLARTAVWCFMHYYKFNAQENLDEQYVLEGITLKDKANVRFWKKLYYKEEQNFTKVTNVEDDIKFDGVKMYSKAGIVLEENRELVYYKNDQVKPEKYGFRRIFSHENNEMIKTVFKDKVTLSAVGYQYLLDMGTSTKEVMCEKILERINRMDGTLLEERLLDNMKRITENIVENLMCEMVEQMVATLNGMQIATGPSTTAVHNETTSNHDFLCNSQTAEKIQNIHKGTFSGTVHMTF